MELNNPTPNPSIDWFPKRQRLVGDDLEDALSCVRELIEDLDNIPSSELPLMLSALLPANCSVLADKTTPSPDKTSIQFKLRKAVLDWMSKLSLNEYLKPHASHLVAVTMNVLTRDYEENAITASRILFELYKTYRNLPADYVQPYLDFVILVYRSLPASVASNFSKQSLLLTDQNSAEDPMDIDKPQETDADPPAQAKEAPKETTPDVRTAETAETKPAPTASTVAMSLKSTASFRVLTECPLVVMLMFQLYPKFMKLNIPVLIKNMMEALALKPPSIKTLGEIDSNIKRLFLARARELVSCQAKTLSFLIFFLRNFAQDLKPYEDRLAANVLTIMSSCPREAVGTRREILVATRHLLNSDFRAGFFRHIDPMLDERILMGTSTSHSSTRSDPNLIRTFAYLTLSDFVHHVRTLLNTTQLSRVVTLFSRVFHEAAQPLPLSTQNAALRTLLSLVDLIFHNKDANSQVGRDLLVRLLRTFVEKLEVLPREYQMLKESTEKKQQTTNGIEILYNKQYAAADSIRDIHSMIRLIIVGQKTIIYYIGKYREQRSELAAKDKNSSGTRERNLPPPGSNEEVASAMRRITHTETALIDRYIVAAFSAMRILSAKGKDSEKLTPAIGETSKPLSEQHRDALTYFAAAFTSMDGHDLRRSLGTRMDLLFDMIVNDNVCMVIPRHLLGSNANTSFEFCAVLLDYLIERIDLLCYPLESDIAFFDQRTEHEKDDKDFIRKCLHERQRLPFDSDERRKKMSAAVLQLFERLLKSLAAYPKNEVLVRKHLRHIVVSCLRSSMENINNWPESFCMLLRYIFRSISAGKFEESYKELLPLIPTVLNGLYRVVYSTNNMVLRSTAIELCLTIPARLSSLLPHMNLLLRIIVPALDSNVGDLVNLGLRTLEFWVDNLNPVFLYPEMSKQTELFSSLMQALSRHLRPAPYQYGLLTLRLLGKLGGKNRQFLRDTIVLSEPQHLLYQTNMTVKCTRKELENEMDDDTDSSTKEVELRLPLNQCVYMLRMVSMDSSTQQEAKPLDRSGATATLNAADNIQVWDCKIEDVDVSVYSKQILERTRNEQAAASFCVLRACIDLADVNKLDNVSKQQPQTEGQGSFPIFPGKPMDDLRLCCLGLLYACTLDITKDEGLALLKEFLFKIDLETVSFCLALFLTEPSGAVAEVGLRVVELLLQRRQAADEPLVDDDFDVLVSALCQASCSKSWDRYWGPQEALCKLVSALKVGFKRKHEVKLLNAAFLPVKTVPRELSCAAVGAVRIFLKICSSLYGQAWTKNSEEDGILWPSVSYNPNLEDQESQPMTDETKQRDSSVDDSVIVPSDDVFRIMVYELASAQQLVRFTARFLLCHFVVESSIEKSRNLAKKNMSLIRRVLFSRSLRLLPLPQQIGIVEGLIAVMSLFPELIPLKDQHVLTCLSELLKMASVADNEMEDVKLNGHLVDKNGYAGGQGKDTESPSYSTHSFSLFFRRDCLFDVYKTRVFVPRELPLGVQLRVSSIQLFHAVIRSHTDIFFDADTNAIGNIRPHVVSLLFRSLVSEPLKAVDSAHIALRDVLSLSASPPSGSATEGKQQSRLPKELLQTCIRPVLLHLKDHSRLSVPLLRGLGRLLSLLSSWFNKTLGEKLLDHLQKWLDPPRIISQKLWRPGDEPLVASAIVAIFASLPHASHFVEHLVKTCIRLEEALPLYKSSTFVKSPFRLPLARYLNKHPHYTVTFFLARLKAPIYSELFQDIVGLEKESADLRAYLSNKQCSVMILNMCFERPLAIIRSEKSSAKGSPKIAPYMHGIGKEPEKNKKSPSSPSQRPMNIEALEMQLQGFRLVETLSSFDPTFFREHNDIVRAFRWLWRSKGRFLRLQHEEMISPRFHDESKKLAAFLMAYAKSLPSEDLDILFELFRVFLQPTTSNFSFVSQFLTEMVTNVLTVEQKRQVIDRFFRSIAGDTNEEIKVLGIQFLVFPMLQVDRSAPAANDGTEKNLADSGVIEKFVNDVIFQKGSPIRCGERLKVELLRLLSLILDFDPSDVKPLKERIVQFCNGLLQSEDSACRGWAYIVLCRLVSLFGTSKKTMRQTYIALLKTSQQEHSELVRTALDTLVPTLETNLEAQEMEGLVDMTVTMITEDGNSVSHLAHIGRIIVRNPALFARSKVQLIPSIVSSLNRLGLHPNAPRDNRIISLDMVELLLRWEKESEEYCKLKKEQTDAIAHFLIRLKLLVSEGPTESRSSSESDSDGVDLYERVSLLFVLVVERWKPQLKVSSMEKYIARDFKHNGPRLACLSIVSCLSKLGRYTLLEQNTTLVQDILHAAVDCARDDSRFQGGLRTLVSLAKATRVLSGLLLIALENVVVEACREQKLAANSREPSRGRGREKTTSNDESTTLPAHALFSLELISKLCQFSNGNLHMVSSSLLTFAKVLSKPHLLDAVAKQRQGSSSSQRTLTSGSRHHTPTIGILEEARARSHKVASKHLLGKNRALNDSVLTTQLRSLTIILSIFESSDAVYLFSQNRKTLLQIICGIIETSDNVQLMAISVRIIAKLLLMEEPGPPFTTKERTAMLGRITAFDFGNLPDDITSQMLLDLVSEFSARHFKRNSNEDSQKLTVLCLLNPDLETRDEMIQRFISGEEDDDKGDRLSNSRLLWRLFCTDYESLGARYWLVAFVDVILLSLDTSQDGLIRSLQIAAHGNVDVCFQLLDTALQSSWAWLPSDKLRLKFVAAIEVLLSKTSHFQFLKFGAGTNDSRCLNVVRTLLNILAKLRPIPALDPHLLVSLAGNYNCWYEVIGLLEAQHAARSDRASKEVLLSAMRQCYRQLGDLDMWDALAVESCSLPRTIRALSLDKYGKSEQAAESYADLMELVESSTCDVEPTSFEMDLWEERWVLLQKEMYQMEVVSEFATASGSPKLQLECAWKSQDWAKVRTLCSSSLLLPSVENGDPSIKLCETLLAVADGKLNDVENLHAQTAQLCLYRWQLLPQLFSGSKSHASLLHFFHRLVEIRESGQIMVETNNHSSSRTLPDLKNLLNAWRHRLPNDWESIAEWDEIFSWRTHMFSAITSNFHWSEPDKLASLHDRPWTSIRMAKTARKQGMRDVSLLLLGKATDERSMNVSDAFLKLREQILAYYNLDSKVERHGGLKLINLTNLSFFDASQKSELFRLKATFLKSLQGRSKANQAFCHAVQICPTHGRAWASWGELCASLGAVTETQLEKGASAEVVKENAKKVRQYLAQAMGCYLEAVQIDGHEWARIHLAKCLWMLTKDGSATGVLCSTIENRGSHLPAWVWLPWIPQLLTSLYRKEGRAVKAILARIVKSHPQAVYYSLRAFYLERRDVDRARGSSSKSEPGEHQESVTHAEELMSLLRKSHASLWSSLESVLEELIVKFRPSYAEELLATLVVLLERAETQLGKVEKKNDEESVVSSIWKTIGKIAVKFFRPTDHTHARPKTAQFKERYKDLFESDFNVSATDPTVTEKEKAPLGLEEVIGKLRLWKQKLEAHVVEMPTEPSLIETSQSLAMFGVGDAPDLWPGACDPYSSGSSRGDWENTYDSDPGTSLSTASSSAAAAKKAAKTAATTASSAALREGVGGDYGGGSSWIEIPGQYAPNTSAWTDVKPSSELHAKLLRFEPTVSIVRQGDTLVRRIGMVASDGRTYRFLLQFAVAYLTRTDERTTQTHYALGKVLQKGIRSSRASLSVQTNPVIPVAQRLRLISEPDSRSSLGDIHRRVCEKRKINHCELLQMFNNEIKAAMTAKSSFPEEAKERQEAEKAIRLEAFSKVSSHDGADSHMLTNYMTSLLDSPELLYQFRRTFSQQWAVNCLLQYTFSAAERIPSKVAFDLNNGRVVVPEFRVFYNNQGCFEKHRAPFRLTPNLFTIIGPQMLEARFIPTLAMIAEAVYVHRHDLDPIFRILMRDDLISFYTKAMAKSDTKTVEMEKQLSSSVARNVATLHTRFAECTPGCKESAEKEKPNDDSPIDHRVRNLVEAATNHENQSMMSANYQGWL